MHFSKYLGFKTSLHGVVKLQITLKRFYNLKQYFISVAVTVKYTEKIDKVLIKL